MAFQQVLLVLVGLVNNQQLLELHQLLIMLAEVVVVLIVEMVLHQLLMAD